MEIKILIDEHKAFNYIRKEKYIFRGTFFYKDKLYTNDNISEIFNVKYNYDEFIDIVKEFNGNFLLIVKFDSDYFVFCDKIMSFPMFYKKNKNCLFLSDCIYKINDNEKFDYEALTELASFGYVLGNKTIYKNIKEIGPGEYLKINCDSNEVRLIKYYQHLHKEEVYSEIEWIDKLDKAINNTFDRFIRRLNNRQVVLFLSGGYDSKLILQHLRKRDYKNVICISLRSCDDLDVVVAKKLANLFQYPLYVFDYNKKYWKDRASKNDFWGLLNKLFNGVAIHYPQGMIVKDLIDKNIIDKNSVIVTGNSGDVVEGNDVCENFKEKVINSKQVVKEILVTHGINVSNNKKINNVLSKNILSILPQYNYNDVSHAQDAYEYFNWRERQCKYVISDVRNYDDYTANEWALPLWDDEFVGFWLSVPIEYRFKRNLYYKYVNKDNLPTANVPTLYGYIRQLMLKYCENIIGIFYPFRQIYGYYSSSIPFAYHSLISIDEWLYLLWITRGNKVKFVTIFTYKLFKEIYGFNIFKLVKEVNRHGKI